MLSQATVLIVEAALGEEAYDHPRSLDGYSGKQEEGKRMAARGQVLADTRPARTPLTKTREAPGKRGGSGASPEQRANPVPPLEIDPSM
jgi:hypothetical protein